MRYRCERCGKATERPAGHVNRSRAAGMKLFCGRRCFGLARRQHKTKAQRVEEKRLYDLEYRAKNLEMLKAKKRAYHKQTYDPVKAAAERKKNMPRHVEYCRRPEYKRWKQTYDRQHLAKKHYGPFAEVALMTRDLDNEIKGRMTKHEIRYQNGSTNKAQRRKREARQEERSRNAPGRRSGDPAPHG